MKIKEITHMTDQDREDLIREAEQEWSNWLHDVYKPEEDALFLQLGKLEYFSKKLAEESKKLSAQGDVRQSRSCYYKCKKVNMDVHQAYLAIIQKKLVKAKHLAEFKQKVAEIEIRYCQLN